MDIITEAIRKTYRAGDAVTAQEINNVINTAVKAYEAASNVMAYIVPVEWQNGMLSIDDNGDLQLNYSGDIQPGFSINQNTGELMLRLSE